MTYDFGRIAPLDFAFIDGAHDSEHVRNDSSKTYEALAPGGWMVWHDFDSPVPWVKVREAIERAGFAEPVVHVEGTEVAFLRKQGTLRGGDDAGVPVEVGSKRPVAAVGQPPPLPPLGKGGIDMSTSPLWNGGTDMSTSPLWNGGTDMSTSPLWNGGIDMSTAGQEEDLATSVREGRKPSSILQVARDCTSPTHVAWEGDFEGLNSLALVNRAICRGLLERGVDLGLIQVEAGPAEDRVVHDDRLAARIGKGPAGGPAQVHVRHQWPPRLEPPPQGRWVLMQPWEYGSLPKAWMPMLRRVDEVWAYSRSVRDCYLEAGVPPERVHVIPLGVDPEVFRPGLDPLPLPPGPSIRFLFVGGTIFRKGIDCFWRPSHGPFSRPTTWAWSSRTWDRRASTAGRQPRQAWPGCASAVTRSSTSTTT